MSAPVVGDDAVALLEEEQHLGVPVVGRQGPAVAEHDGLALAPVLVEDLDAVFGGDRVHDCSFGWGGLRGCDCAADSVGTIGSAVPPMLRRATCGGRIDCVELCRLER